MTRQRIASELGVSESKLRLWEDRGLMPRWDPERVGVYIVRARLVMVARANGFSGQEVRRALGVAEVA